MCFVCLALGCLATATTNPPTPNMNMHIHNQVADELVAEVLSPQVDPLTGEVQPPECQYDEKNIRRRVYDALNVLMAMDIISKEKKEIRWKGLPSHAQVRLGSLLGVQDGR